MQWIGLALAFHGYRLIGVGLLSWAGSAWPERAAGLPMNLLDTG
jgi:hypothetical protein